MTTILYDGLGGLHGDRQRAPRRTTATKVHRVGQGLLGTSGSAGEGIRLRRFIERECRSSPPERWPELPKSTDLMAIYVHYDGRVYLIDTTSVPIEQERDRPTAIGCGGDLALGAFAACGSVHEAMRVAHRFDVDTGEEFDSVFLLPQEPLQNYAAELERG